ncbi:MAG: efflux RND transporter permease subunit, partial [Rhodospirillales bacterium]|nr:efflux RND transporter permease subunit [Rhodospirillales bacterium]
MSGKTGLIGLFIRHPTAANLLMAVMVIGGIFALSRINTQFFPDFGIDIISVQVKWPGAGAEDMDSNVVEAIEPEVRFLDGVKKVVSDSLEGFAVVTIEYEPNTDMQTALSNVETAVGQITTLPEDSERPIVRRVTRYDTISRLILSGPFPESSLKAYAKKIRDTLLDKGVDKVDLVGARDEEIWVDVEPGTLRRFDLTLDDISARIAATSKDLPSGGTRGEAERQIRSLGLVKEARELRDIEIKSLPNGQKVRLGDIADVSESFTESDSEVRSNGERAIELHIMRSVNADALKIADTVEELLADLEKTLPPGLKVQQYDIMSDLIRGRMELLLRNGAQGLVLVLAILFLFLNFRVGFWVAAAIPVSLLATVLLMLGSGQTINMVSLFALIMVLGIIVDDSIVVGEYAEARHKAGLPPAEAAEAGARRMAIPVMASSLTTIAAFLPLFIISDIIGKIISAIPYVAVVVILASLVECFFVLPNHMRHALSRTKRRHEGDTRLTPRRRFNDAFDRFRDGPFQRAVRFCVEWRYATLACATAALLISLGVVAGGRIGFHFFNAPEADKVYGNVQMVPGTPRSATFEAVREMERALRVAEANVTAGKGGLVRIVETSVGQKAGRDTAIGLAGDNVGGLIVELTPSDQRTIRTDTLLAAWRNEIRHPAGVDTMTAVPAQTGPPGLDVDIRISGDDVSSLKSTANEVKRLLASYPGVSAIEDDLPYGKEETIISLTPKGAALGFTTESIGRQVRAAFEGTVAKRFPRGDEEVAIRVQYPRDAIEVGAIHSLYLRGPNGDEVALEETAALEGKHGFARVRREDGARRVAVTAEIDKALTSTGAIVEALNRDGLDAIMEKNGVTVHFAGRAEEQERTFGDMRIGAMLGMTAIYIILAWVFASYLQPLVVMSVIPLAFVGSVVGHLLMGYDMTILSMVALIGLSGIVVNDSIILVSTIKDHLEQHEDFIQAIV